MSTNSVIAMAIDGPPLGRYCHWDGYPTGVGLALHTIVARDGLQLAARTLLHDWTGWSSLTAGEADPDALSKVMGDPAPRFVPVAGYGIAYSRAEQPDEWIPLEHAEQCGAEWAYELTPDRGLAVYRVDVAPFLIGRLDWSATPEQARAELESMEAKASA